MSNSQFIESKIDIGDLVSHLNRYLLTPHQHACCCMAHVVVSCTFDVHAFVVFWLFCLSSDPDVQKNTIALINALFGKADLEQRKVTVNLSIIRDMVFVCSLLQLDSLRMYSLFTL